MCSAFSKEQIDWAAPETSEASWYAPSGSESLLQVHMERRCESSPTDIKRGKLCCDCSHSIQGLFHLMMPFTVVTRTEHSVMVCVLLL